MYAMAVLCGGLGTRMRPVTESIPKALIPLNGEPFMAHLLRLLASKGFTRVVLCVSNLGEKIERYVGDGSTFGLRAEYSYDGPTQIGTGGAIKKAIGLLGEAFFVAYGDSYLSCDYAAIQRTFEGSKADGLMTVYHNRGTIAPSNVSIDGGRIVEYLKGATEPRFEFIDYGVGVFRSAAFSFATAGEALDLSEVVRALIARRSLAMFEVSERFYEIGSPEGLAETAAYIQRRVGT